MLRSVARAGLLAEAKLPMTCISADVDDDDDDGDGMGG